jgi:ribosome-binding factor A
MKPFARSDRVGGQIQKLLSTVLQKEIKDPRLDLAVITGVKLTRDLKSARIYYTVNGDDRAKEQACEAFKNARGFVKRTLAARLGLRYMPDLIFFYDDSFDYGSHIDEVLKSLNIDDESDHTTPEG